MGIRTKSKPQSRIHFKCSAEVTGRPARGCGLKKSSRLNPFHCGKLFACEVTGKTSAEFFTYANPAVNIPVFLMNFLRCIGE